MILCRLRHSEPVSADPSVEKTHFRTANGASVSDGEFHLALLSLATFPPVLAGSFLAKNRNGRTPTTVSRVARALRIHNREQHRGAESILYHTKVTTRRPQAPEFPATNCISPSHYHFSAVVRADTF